MILRSVKLVLTQTSESRGICRQVVAFDFESTVARVQSSELGAEGEGCTITNYSSPLIKRNKEETVCGSISMQNAPSRPSGSAGLGCTKGAHRQEHVGFEKVLLSNFGQAHRGVFRNKQSRGFNFFLYVSACYSGNESKVKSKDWVG